MLDELIPLSAFAEWTCMLGSRSLWVYSPLRLLRSRGAESEQRVNPVQENPPHAMHSCAGGTSEFGENREEEYAAFNSGHSLFQELFFYTNVKNVGDVPGAGCIYVETVVDRDSGLAFAKLYSAKNAMNAVDILASRVIPFFERQGEAIKEIHTRKTDEYCGLLPLHPFETFLATSHIQHLPMEQPGHPSNSLCERFYQFLLKEFFMPALRRTFQVTLDGLQKDLGAFVAAYNAMQLKHENDMQSGPHPSTNSPVDL